MACEPGAAPGLPDEAAVLAWLDGLRRLERGGERTTLVIGPWTAFILIGVVQLAMRHPRLPPDQRRVAAEWIAQVRTLFDGTPGEAIIAVGDRPENDVQP